MWLLDISISNWPYALVYIYVMPTSPTLALVFYSSSLHETLVNIGFILTIRCQLTPTSHWLGMSVLIQFTITHIYPPSSPAVPVPSQGVIINQLRPWSICIVVKDTTMLMTKENTNQSLMYLLSSPSVPVPTHGPIILSLRIPRQRKMDHYLQMRQWNEKLPVSRMRLVKFFDLLNTALAFKRLLLMKHWML